MSVSDSGSNVKLSVGVGKNDVVYSLLLEGFSERTHAEKLEIVKGGRPQPNLPNLLSEHKEKSRSYTRSFNTHNYVKYQWLTGSQTRNKLYCWPCLLFSPEEDGPWNKAGFDGLNYLTTACIKHQGSLNHIRAFACLIKFGKKDSDRVEHAKDLQKKIADQKHNEKVTENRAVLKRLIDAVIFLGKQECSFGNDESDGSMYIELLNFLSDYNPILANHLKSPSNFKGTSPQIQNDLINCVAGVVRDQIELEISESDFVAILLDETSDISNTSQLSTVIRFIDKNGACQERFLHLIDVSMNRTAEGLFDVVKEVLSDLNCSEKIVADTIDGAAVMSSHLGGLQALIRNEYPMANFVHCYAHSLSLVLLQSTMTIIECKRFFITLQGLSDFFTYSTNRTERLKDFMTKKLPGIAPTSWNITSGLVTTIKNYRLQLIEFFLSVDEDPSEWSSEDVIQASGFVCFLTKLETQFLLYVFSEVFLFSDKLFNIFQKKSFDVSYCIKEVKDFNEFLQKKRDLGFDEVWLKTTQNQESEEVSPSSTRTESGNEIRSKYSQIYLEIIDIMMYQIKLRFESLSQIKFINLMNTSSFQKFHEKFPENLIKNLKERYAKLFDLAKLRNELTVFYAEKGNWNKPLNVLITSMKKERLDIVFTEVYRLAQLVLTMPLTSAFTERSCSALNRIKDYLRSTKSQKRQSSLAVMSIEKDLLVKMKTTQGDFYSKVIESFVKEGGRLDFMYK